MTAQAERLVSKGELARHVGVSPSAISKYFERGILGKDVLDGEGMRAKIRLEPALRQIRLRRDPGQALGNGFKVNTAAPPPPAEADLIPFPEANPVRGEDARTPGPERDEVGERLRLAKLEREEIATRTARRQELADQGAYVRTAEVQAGYARLASLIVTAIEATFPDIAQEIAADLDVPSRDVQHAIRKAFAKARTKAAEAVRRTAGDLPETVPDAAAQA